MTANFRIAKKSIATRLQEAGAPGEFRYDPQAGALRYIVDGESMTPGEAAERYLSEHDA